VGGNVVKGAPRAIYNRRPWLREPM